MPQPDECRVLYKGALACSAKHSEASASAICHEKFMAYKRCIFQYVRGHGRVTGACSIARYWQHTHALLCVSLQRSEKHAAHQASVRAGVAQRIDSIKSMFGFGGGSGAPADSAGDASRSKE